MKDALLYIIKGKGFCNCDSCIIRTKCNKWKLEYWKLNDIELWWIDFKKEKARQTYIEKYGEDSLVEELL